MLCYLSPGNDEDESMDSHNIDYYSSDEEDNIPLAALGNNNLFGSSSSGEMSMDESSDTGSF